MLEWWLCDFCLAVFEAFKEERVKTDWILTVLILSIWSASLLQFTLVLTASVAAKIRPGFQSSEVRGMAFSR